MGWVEELKPDDDVEVEIIYPEFYIEHNLTTMRRYAAGISNICKGYALLGEDAAEFIVFGLTVVQVYSLEEVLKRYGIEMEHEHGLMPDGSRWTYFYADITKLKQYLEEGFDNEDLGSDRDGL